MFENVGDSNADDSLSGIKHLGDNNNDNLFRGADTLAESDTHSFGDDNADGNFIEDSDTFVTESSNQPGVIYSNTTQNNSFVEADDFDDGVDTHHIDFNIDVNNLHYKSQVADDTFRCLKLLRNKGKRSVTKHREFA